MKHLKLISLISLSLLGIVSFSYATNNEVTPAYASNEDSSSSEVVKDDRQETGWIVPISVLGGVTLIGIGVGIYYYVHSKHR